MRYKTGLAIILACLLSFISIQGSRAEQRAPEERPPVYDLQQKPKEKPPIRAQQPTIVPESKEEKKDEKKDEFYEYKTPAEQRALEGRPPVRYK